jgi:RNA polymerase-associated protein
MRLYMLPTCPYAHRAAFVLREKRVHFDVTFFEHGKRPPELEEVGPRAKSPTIFDGEVRVYDSGVVLEYLEERFPEPHLLPGDLQERAEVRMLIARYNDEIAPKYGPIVKSITFEQPRDEAKVRAAKEAFLGALPPWNEHFAERTYAVGSSLSLADITLYTFFPWLKAHADIDIPPALTHLRLWHDRMRARPAAPIPQAP